MTEISELDVGCPQCAAVVGEFCRTPKGVEKMDFHVSRTRAAAAARGPVESEGETEGEGEGETDVPCAACGSPCSGESSVYPTDEADEEVLICDLCADCEVEEIRRRIRTLAGCQKAELCEAGMVSDEACDGCEHRAPEGEDQPPAEVTVRTITRTIHCQLPDDEIVERTMEILRLERQVETIKADAKETIKPKTARIGELKTQIRQGEERQVKCERRADYRTGELVVIRLDTLEEIERRALTAEEREQPELPLVEQAEPAEPAIKCDECALRADCRDEDGDPHEDCPLTAEEQPDADGYLPFHVPTAEEREEWTDEELAAARDEPQDSEPDDEADLPDVDGPDAYDDEIF